MALILGWYFHLPPCADDAEVSHLADENLGLLLDAHARTAAPVGIALTGSLLERLDQRHPDVIARLRGGVAAGWLEIIATSAYETCAPALPLHYLQRQIDADAQVKRRLLGVVSRVFWPGNLAWTPAFEQLLASVGVQRCIVDEEHVRTAQDTQLWHWLADDAPRLQTRLVDTTFGDPVAGVPYRLATGLGLLVQSRSRRAELSFGTRGAIHRAWDDAALDAVAQQLETVARDEASLVFVGDDGDRVNPVSIHQYRRLLDRIGRHLSLPSADVDAGPRLRLLGFLPAYVPGGEAFWRDEAALAWLRVLDDLYRAVDAGRLDTSDVLPLQDVFPIFWKRTERARWFYERAWQLLAPTSGDSPPAAPRR